MGHGARASWCRIVKDALLSGAPWLGWVIATMTAAVTMMSYTYGTFQTKVEAELKDQTIQVQLDAIKKSLDRLHETLDHRRR